MRSNLGGLNQRWFLAGTIFAMAVVFSLFVNTTEGAHIETTSLTFSNFEIDEDANLRNDDGLPSFDWENVENLEEEAIQRDADSGSGDDSFGKGTKEDTAVPEPVVGSIPPNKSDLKAFGVYLEENAEGKFMHLFWTRVQDPNGTTNMDFEFNQSSVISSNQVTPERAAGDFLLEYKLTKGGTIPKLFLYTWLGETGDVADCVASSSLPCWGDKTNLTDSGDAAGSINTSLIPGAESYGMGDLGPYTFGDGLGSHFRSQQMHILRIGLPEEPLFGLLHLCLKGFHRAADSQHQ